MPDWREWRLLPALLLATLAVYQPVWHGGVLWDDTGHITRAELQTVDGLRRIWFEIGATQQYYPVAHSAFWVQHRLWGDDTLGYHLVNISLHALSAFLLLVILRRLKARGAVLAAIIFALHPVQVESVAWMTELKNTLSGAFYLAAALAYLEFDEHRRTPRYILAILLFVLALLSKTVTATLPAALLVVFWWQRGRLEWRKDVIPLTPFFVIGVVGGLSTAWLERTLIGAEGTSFAFTFVERCLIAGRAIWFYLATLVWPGNLIFIYPRWEVSQGVWWQYLYPLVAVALVGALWLWRRRSRAPLAAMLFFGGTLFPALGFVNVYPFRYSFVADHFQYLASIGIIAMFAAGLASLAERWRLRPAAAAAVTLAVAVPLAVLTWNQSHQYIDAGTLYRATLSRNPSSWMAHNNLGNLELGDSPDRLEDALAHFREALRINPGNAESRNGLGVGLQRLGRFDDSIIEFKEAVRLSPAFADFHANLALALAQRGRLEDSVVEYQATLRLRPNSATTHSSLGFILAQTGRFEDAVSHLKEAVQLRPDDASGYYALGSVLQGMGQIEAAVAQYQEALRHVPGADEPSIHNELGQALAKLGRFEEAASHFREALRLKPDLPGVRESLANVSTALGTEKAK